MSFRNRLTLFFVLIVLVPMLSLAAVLFGLISDNEEGKADANLAGRLEVAVKFYAQAIKDANNAVRDREDQYERMAAALRDGDLPAARARARALARNEPVERIVLVRNGEVVVEVGTPDATAPARRVLERQDGTTLAGELQVSVLRAGAFSRRVSRFTGAQVVVRAGGRVLGTSKGLDDRSLPEMAVEDNVEIDGVEYRTLGFAAPGFEGRRVQVSVLRPKQATRAEVQQARILAGAILLGFFALAFVFALAVSRSLAQQVAGLLEAARRLGRGDFSTRVPTTGRDEFAALGEEFNKMSDQLEQRLAELRHERER
ncbi:MAG TPA: HAMP domain-containing protein, partial [Solirubrobacteraceae bacterium]|nr:HAMP domain-containing protein [Solirubrobacteraceae bacterium]